MTSTQPWPESVERVATFLREAGAEARIEEFKTATPTAAEAARAAGCDLGQIVKSLILECDGRSLLVMVPGNRRADLAKVARARGCSDAQVATAEQVQAATGFAPGAVAPFPLARIDAVFLDRWLLAHEVVWIGAGSPNHLAALAPSELVRLARARVMDAAEDPT